jgi:FkbM family methyltransferase
MTSIPLWMRAMRWYALHSPVQRGIYRLALRFYQRRAVPDIEVETTLDRTLAISLRLRVWVDYNIYCLGFYEAPLARFFIQSLRPESVVLDVGAYIGQYTMLAAKYASAGHVFAFEPHPESCQRLKAHIDRNRLTSVTIVPRAAGEIAGRMPFALTEIDSNSGLLSPDHPDGSVVEVEVTTVDDVVREAGLQRVNAMKVDVEGAEGLVLRGAQETLARFHPLLIVEINRKRDQAFGDDPETILGQLENLGYNLYFLRRHRLTPTSSRSVDYDNVIAIPAAERRDGES